MKTPEEIKKELACELMLLTIACNLDCDNCERYVPGYEAESCAADALAYIKQLEAERDDEKNKKEILIFDTDKLMEEIAQAERERDAAVRDLENSAPCFACYHFMRNKGACKGGMRCCDEQFRVSIGMSEYDGPEWQWRGVCPENTKEDGSDERKPD